MIKIKRTRMYCDEEFKKLIDIKRIEYGEKDTISFTNKVAKNPSLLNGVTKKNVKKEFKTPKLF